MKKKKYRNVFLEAGISRDEIENRVEETFWEIFYGPDKFYFENGDGTGYVMDTGNYDVRTEGMSYAMMMCVQLGKKKEFDALWKWARTYMYMEEGENKGYFAWSVHPDGQKNSYGPAPDGKSFLQWLYFLQHIVLVMGREFSVIQKKQGIYCPLVYIKERMAWGLLCGIRRII